MKILIATKDGHNVNINTEMQGQDLYELIVALLGYTALQLNSISDLDKLAKTAVSDAKGLLKEKQNKMLS